MKSVKCPQCGRRLRLKPDFEADLVSCPACQKKFRIRHPQPGIEIEVPEVPEIDSLVFSSEATDSNSASNSIPLFGSRRNRLANSGNILDVFDLTFQKYVTPLIVRITWVVFLTSVAIGICLATLSLITFLTNGQNAVGWNGPSSSSFLPAFLVESPRLLRITAYIVQLTAFTLSVLWVRLALESVIVVFDMSNSLKAIKEKEQ